VITAFTGVVPEPSAFASDANRMHHFPCVHDGDGSAGRDSLAAFHADVRGVTHVCHPDNCPGDG